jgi:hypothetical protein
MIQGEKYLYDMFKKERLIAILFLSRHYIHRHLIYIKETELDILFEVKKQTNKQTYYGEKPEYKVRVFRF